MSLNFPLISITVALLDVGFGAGTLLSAARNAGWQAFGVDVAERAAACAREMGFEVFCGTLQQARYPESYFDVVTASEVLEHVPDPQSVVLEIARVLRPGGLLWLTTPHDRGLSAKILGLNWSVVSPPEHLQLMSPTGCRSMLQAAGVRLTVSLSAIRSRTLDPDHMMTE